MRLALATVALVLVPSLGHATSSPAAAPPTFLQIRREQRAIAKQTFAEVLARARAMGVPTRMRLLSGGAAQGLSRVAAAALTAASVAFVYKNLTTPGVPLDSQTFATIGFWGGFGPLSGAGVWGLGNAANARARGAILRDAERLGFALAPEVREQLLRSGYVAIPSS